LMEMTERVEVELIDSGSGNSSGTKQRHG